MRNLKRALSLTLASVMLLGMMVVGAGAASYPDVDSNDNIEAIEVLQAVQVMRGDDKGNFNPDSPVTRAEMAVVMALLLDLDYDYYASTCPFTDVPEWARPYVGACYANKIVAGYSANTYGPNDGVTAVQASAMMMRALGYFQTDADYADGFETATVRQGTRIGIYKGVGSSANVALTRNQVAQMALNALQCTMVDAKKNSADITVGSGDTAVTITGNVEYVVRTSSESFAYAINDTENNSGGVNGVAGATIELGEQLYNGDLKKESYENGDGIRDVFGAPATRWTYKTTEIGTYSEEADATYTAEVKSKDLYKDLGMSVSVNTAARGGLVIYEDGVAVSTIGDDSFDTIAQSGAKGDDKLGGNGVLVKAYKYENNGSLLVTLSVMNTYLAQVDGAYNSDSGKLELDMLSTGAPAVETTLEDDDFGGLSRFDDGDYILVNVGSTNGLTTGQEIMTIAAAEVLTGEVSKYTKGSNVTVNGDPYKYSPNFYNNADGNDSKDVEYEVGKDSKFVLDSYGYIIGLDEVNGASSYVYIDEFRKEGNYSKNEVYRGDAYFTDGTNEDIVLNKIDGESITGVDTDDGAYVTANGTKNAGWYKYTTTNDGKYNLTSETNVGGAITDTDTKVIENGETKVVYGPTAASYLRANNSTAFIVRDGDDIYTATGIKDAATVTTAHTSPDTVVMAVKSGNYAPYVFVDVGNGEVKGASKASGDAIFILSTDYSTHKDSNGEYYTYDAILNGREIKKNSDNAVRTDDTGIFTAVGLYTEVYYDDNGQVSDADLVTADLLDDDAGVEKDLEDVVIIQKGQTVIFGTIDKSVYLNGFVWVIEKDGSASRETVNSLVKKYNENTPFTGNVWATFKDGDATGLYVQEADVGGGNTKIAATVDLSEKVISKKGATFTGNINKNGTVDLTSLRQVRAGDVVGTITFDISGAGKISNVVVTMSDPEVKVVSVKIITTKDGEEVVNAEVAVADNGVGTVTDKTDVETTTIAIATTSGSEITKVEYGKSDLSEGESLPLVNEQGELVGTVKNDGGTVSVEKESGVTIGSEATITDGDTANKLEEDGSLGAAVTMYTVAGTTGDITDSTAKTKTFSITSDVEKAVKGDTVTLTITLAEAVPADAKVTVTIAKPEGISPVEFAAGEKEQEVTFTMGEANVKVEATAAETAVDDDNTGDKDPTADLKFELTSPTGDGNTITPDQTKKTVAVAVVTATESVKITVTKGEGQEIAVDGTGKESVTEKDGVYTVDTSAVKDGGKVEFTLTVTENEKDSITYTVTVTVADKDGGDDGDKGEATAATYVVSAPSQDYTKDGDKDTVTIGGLAYAAAAKENAELADHITAWVTGFNADTETAGNWTAAVGESDNDGKIVFTNEKDTIESEPNDFPVEGAEWVDGAEKPTFTLNNPAQVDDILSSSKIVVTIASKEYEVENNDENKADAISAWVKAFNDDAKAKESATAAYDKESGKITFTAAETGSGVTKDLFESTLGLSGGTFAEGTDAEVKE